MVAQKKEIVLAKVQVVGLIASYSGDPDVLFLLQRRVKDYEH